MAVENTISHSGELAAGLLTGQEIPKGLINTVTQEQAANPLGASVFSQALRRLDPSLAGQFENTLTPQATAKSA